MVGDTLGGSYPVNVMMYSASVIKQVQRCTWGPMDIRTCGLESSDSGHTLTGRD